MGTVNLSPERVYATAVCNKIANDTDALGKVSKVVVSLLDISAYILAGASETFKEVGVVFKDLNDLTGAVGLIDRGVEMFDSKERTKAFASWESTCAKVSLIVGQFFSFVSFVDKMTYKSLSRAAYCIGGLPIVDLVKNIGFAVSSLATIYIELKKLGVLQDEVAKKSAMLKIAAEVSKLFMITIGTAVAIFKGYASAQFLLAFTVLGLASNMIGLIENLWKNVFSKTAQQLIAEDREHRVFPENVQIAAAV